MLNCGKSNHQVLSLLSKGILGGSTGLLTKGIISDLIDIVIITKKGKKGGSSGFVASRYDKDYWKRFRREVEEDDDEIDIIIVKIKKKHLTQKYKISAELIRPQIELELLEMELYDDNDNKPTIKVELVNDSFITPKISTQLIIEDDVKKIEKDIKVKLIKESFIYKKKT